MPDLTRLEYVGPFTDGIEFYPADKDVQIVTVDGERVAVADAVIRKGSIVEVPDKVAKTMIGQVDNWKPAPARASGAGSSRSKETE